jgi:single-strand selective monofunctional uracil DNA glycosylase
MEMGSSSPPKADNSDDTAELKRISAVLATECSALSFGPKVQAVYNPLVYAACPHSLYLELAGASPKRVIFLGMNPGPWGMAQTGVPFGEVAAVRDWLGIEAAVGKPEREHPRRPIEGFACKRSEVSGRRLWGLFRGRFSTPAGFFREHFVANYCPLVFMDSSGANVTPDKLSPEESAPLFEICDRALAETIELLKPEWVIGIGGFAEKRVRVVRERINQHSNQHSNQQHTNHQFSAARILHPSPANPGANSGWQDKVVKSLIELGVW